MTSKRYKLRPGIGDLVVKGLLERKCPSEVAQELGISTSLEQYHRGKAIRDFVIVPDEKVYPLLYHKGPKYKDGVYKIRKGRRSPKFVNPEARVHAGNGSSYRVKVTREGDFCSVTLSEGQCLPLFPRKSVGKPGKQHFNAILPIPAKITGNDGANATVVFYPDPDINVEGGILEISPPELLLDLDQLLALQSGALPFQPIIDYIINILSRYGGWKFGGALYQSEEVHYAFARSIVEPLIPGFIDGLEVHALGLGDRETDYELFRDLSIPEGELETTKLDMAKDILARLSEEFKKRTGER